SAQFKVVEDTASDKRGDHHRWHTGRHAFYRIYPIERIAPAEPGKAFGPIGQQPIKQLSRYRSQLLVFVRHCPSAVSREKQADRLRIAPLSNAHHRSQIYRVALVNL